MLSESSPTLVTWARLNSLSRLTRDGRDTKCANGNDRTYELSPPQSHVGSSRLQASIVHQNHLQLAQSHSSTASA